MVKQIILVIVMYVVVLFGSVLLIEDMINTGQIVWQSLSSVIIIMMMYGLYKTIQTIIDIKKEFQIKK